MTAEGERRVEIVVCERHGLKYNAAEADGCVRCRREAAGVGSPAPASAPGRPVGAERPASAVAQLLLAAILVGGTGTLFWSAHQEILASAREALEAEDRGFSDDGGEAAYGDWDSDPAVYPPEDGVAIGPAEEQRQMRELMRQMQEDEEREAEAARARAREAAEDDSGYYGDDGY